MNKLDVWDAYWWDAWFDFSEGGVMRLKQHREDVKDLRLMADPHVQDIARRYLNLIRMEEKMIVKIDKKRVKKLLNHIEDKDSFILDLVRALNRASEKNNPSYVEACLIEWEASAELNTVPGLSKRVCGRYNSLVKAGLINER